MDRDALGAWIRALKRGINPVTGRPLIGYHPDIITLRGDEIDYRSGMKEHDPSDCKICLHIGDYANTPDTDQWFIAHQAIGINLRTMRTGKSSTVFEAR